MTDLFVTHNVSSLVDIAPFAQWLTDMARQDELIAMALRSRQKKIAFSTRDDCWVIDVSSDAGLLACGVLRTQLVDQERLKFATRYAAQDIVDTCRFLGDKLGVEYQEMYRSIAPAVVGDLTAAAQCINQPVTPASKFRRIDHDAFEVALLLPQYTHAIATYYTKVGLPLAKLLAETVIRKKATSTPEWWVTYNDLWLRVLTFFTGDPTLGWAFQEHRDPIEAVATLLKVPVTQARVIMLWQACGRDMDAFATRFGPITKELPDDLVSLGDQLNRTLPGLSLACTQMTRAYWDTRTVTTLFERRLRPGHPLGEAVAFRVFGTVEEIVACAAVTFWNNRPYQDVIITGVEGGPSAEVIRITGVGPSSEVERQTWLMGVKQLAPLANPLGMLSLDPTVVLA